ncbi:MAG: HAD hydrolase-like protein [Bacilli bacterium]|nr:HAD hydrolase-like protein [Bacilli bacterium]
MIIGIDVDDTLVSTSESFELVKKKHNLNFNKKFKDKFSKDEWNFICKNYLEETLKGAKLKEDAKEVLNYLNSLGYKLVIITARSNKYCKNIEEFTIEFLKKENIKISEFYFGKHKKSDLAKRLNLYLMIDDSEFVYKNMKKDNIDCILFGDKIKNWKEVLEYIKREEQ